MIYELSCLSILNWFQSASTDAIYLSVSNEITLTQLVSKNIRTRRASNQLVLSNTVDVDRSVSNLSVTNTLYLYQNARPQAIEISVLSPLILWQTLRQPIWEQINQTIGIAQTLVEHKCNVGSNTLVLTQTIGLQVIRSIQVESVLDQSSYVSVIGTGSQFIVQIAPAINDETQVTFTYGNFTFNVRKPDWNNKKTLEFSRINRRSRGGDLIIYRDEDWPESICLKMVFSTLTETERNLFKILYRLSLGRLIRYDDHFGQAWSGILLNPGDPIVQTGRNQWTANIELQGSKL